MPDPTSPSEPPDGATVGADAPAPGAQLRGLRLRGQSWSGVDLSGADLIRSDLSGADLRGADLRGVRAHSARLRGAQLSGAIAHGLLAREADLEGAVLTGAQLQGARLRGAILLDARLDGADLRDADLSGADLRYADLRGADLRSARVNGADLRHAMLDGAQLDRAWARHAQVDHCTPQAQAAALIDAGAYVGVHPHLKSAYALSRAAAAGSRDAAVASRRVLARTGRRTGAAARARWARTREDIRARAQRARERSEVQRSERSTAADRRTADRDARRDALADARVREVAREAARKRARQAERRAARARRNRPERVLRPLPSPAPAPPVDREARWRATLQARRQRLRNVENEVAEAQLEALRDLGRRAREDAQRRESERRAVREAERAAERAKAAEADARAHAEARAAQAEADRLRTARLAAERADVQAREAAAASEAARLEREAAAAALAQAAKARASAELAAQRREAEPIAAERTAADRVTAERPADRGRDGDAPDEALSPSAHETPTPDAPGTPSLGAPTAWWRRLTSPSAPKAPPAAGADLRGQKLGAVDWSGAQFPGIRFDGAQMLDAVLRDANLTGARADGARMDRADLGGCDLTEASLDGARLRDARLVSAVLTGARLVDADLRGADLSGADLRKADLTGADLRRTSLTGARLDGADLTAARLSDLSLAGAVLDNAVLDQADLAGADWADASVKGADLTGALGLSGRDRTVLTERGARAREQGLDELIGRLAPRQIQAALAVLGLGLTAYLAARYLSIGAWDVQRLEAEAEEMRSVDPLEASRSYEDLAAAAHRNEGQVGYLLEAAGLAELGGDLPRAEALLAQALAATEEDSALASGVRLRQAAFEASQGDWQGALDAVGPVVELEGQHPEDRARALVLYTDALDRLERPADGRIEAVYAQLADLPEAEADLRLAVAELRSTRGDTDLALGELTRIAQLDLPVDLALKAGETRARVLDRAGRLEDAAAAWEQLLASAEPGGLSWQASRLDFADLRHRQGRVAEAQVLIDPLLVDGTDRRVQGRAWLVSGRLHEQADELGDAAHAYRRAVELSDLDPETTEEARIGLARVLLAGGEAADRALAGLSEEAATSILLHARLGEARQTLDAGKSAAALELYDAVLADPAADDDLARAARGGRAEALAGVGELNEAVRIWRELLAESTQGAEERIFIEIQLAHGLLQGGDADEAAAAFRSLSLSDDADIRFQGILGMAEVARAKGERERARALYQQVADRAPDPNYRVQALQELADLAAEEHRTEDTLTALRTLLGALPAGHPAATDARLSMVLALADAGQFDDALVLCEQARATAAGPAQRATMGLACGELLERAGRIDDAASAYSAVLDARDLPLDARVDAALGRARVAMDSDEPDIAITVLNDVLPYADTPELSLPLHAMRVQAMQTAQHDGLNQARADRDSVAAEAPRLAGPILIDAAGRARARADLDEAAELLTRALDLPMAARPRLQALIELGEVQSQLGALDAASQTWEAAVEAAGDDKEQAFAAGMGIADLHLRRGDASEAAQRYADLSPPDSVSRRWWLEALAGAHTAAGDDDDAISAWTRLADASGDDRGTLSTALRGQADVHFGRDAPDEALPLYREAAASAPEPSGVGWARLGEARSLAALDDHESALALLDDLRRHPDPEVSIQAAIEACRAHAHAERWQDAIDALAGAEPDTLGPGWHATATEARAAALIGFGDVDGAQDAWRALAERWPDEPEAALPAWLGLARIAQSIGDQDTAKEWAQRALSEAQDPGYAAQAEQLIAEIDG